MSDSPAPRPRRLHSVYLALGSNLGDRDDHLRAAIAALPPAVEITAVSPLYDSAPQLVEDQPRFHNIVCAGRTALAPHALLRTVKRTETALGRIPGPRYGPRVIDIDLLLYEQRVIASRVLVLPHPRLAERAFVLLPLRDIAPDLRLPRLGQTVATLAAAVAGQDANRVGPLLATLG